MASIHKETSAIPISVASRDNKSRILVVDDEEGIREIISSMLTTSGYDFVAAADGIEALEILNSDSDFDLLLCNLMMPRLDGLGVLQQAKVKYPDIPFVLQTAVHDISVLIAAVRDGAYDYLRAPFEREQLLIVVERAIEYRRLKLENRVLKARLEGEQRTEKNGADDRT